MRRLFPNTTLVKRWASEQFALATRLIYADHPYYSYDDDDQKTKVVIMPTFGDSDVPGKRPKILSQSGGYDFSLQDTLGGNLAEELYEDGRRIGTRYVKQVGMSMMILVQAYAEEESSDMADELAMLIVAQASHVYASYGLAVTRVSVGETNVLDGNQKTYQTVVSLTVEATFEVDDIEPQGQGEIRIEFEPEGEKVGEVDSSDPQAQDETGNEFEPEGEKVGEVDSSDPQAQDETGNEFEPEGEKVEEVDSSDPQAQDETGSDLRSGTSGVEGIGVRVLT